MESGDIIYIYIYILWVIFHYCTLTTSKVSVSCTEWLVLLDSNLRSVHELCRRRRLLASCLSKIYLFLQLKPECYTGQMKTPPRNPPSPRINTHSQPQNLSTATIWVKFLEPCQARNPKPQSGPFASLLFFSART